MTLPGGILLLLAVPFGLWLLGARLARTLPDTTSGERLAWSLLAGLCVLTLMLAVANAFAPLRGWAAWLCLAPVLLACNASTLATGGRDVRALFSVRGAALSAGAAIFLALLLWPRLSRPEVLFYDGTANHDAFFWVTGAQRLQQASYLAVPALDGAHPESNITPAISGWSPAWGRMGAEGYLALLSSLTGSSPLGLYLFASAALFFPWLAAVFLFVRGFVVERLRTPALFALGALQPLFAFAHHNANLPNLLGVLAGAVPLLIVARNLRVGADRVGAGECLLGALGVHGVLCTYPELAPFVALPIALLLMRGRFSGRAIVPLAAALLAGALIWPVTTWRAIHGFGVSFVSARASEFWANILSSVPASGFLPAWVTLSPKTGTELGGTGGALATAALVAIFAWTIFRARDRWGLLLALSGGAALALYTAATGFTYGWQKTMQFSAVPVAAVLPVGAIAVAATDPRRRSQLLLLGLAGFFVYAQAIITLDLAKWSERKAITTDWLRLDAHLRDRPGLRVAVDPVAFPQPFFFSMWAPVFLREAGAVDIVDRGPISGGYLRSTLATVPTDAAPAAALVSRDWAATWDANSPRRVEAGNVVLLARANRLIASSGFSPAFGVPQRVERSFSVALMAHTDAELQVEISRGAGEGTWQVSSDDAGATPTVATERESWLIRVRLAGGRRQAINFRFVPADPAREGERGFALRRLAIR